jgi:predicted phage terminase large subunit-like protein
MFFISERSTRAALCRKSFYEFFKMVWPVIVAEELKKNWHIQYLCIEVQKVVELIFQGKPKEYDLVINVPPGSSKSTIISQALPAWTWTRMPSFRSINGSHSMDLALRDSVRSRDIVESDFFHDHFGKIVLRDDENTKGLFTNTMKGGRLAVSVGSKVTGFHGHLLTVDDPMDPEESFSIADMKKVNRWMTNTIPSRGLARADTPMIICQQRLAQNDPSGERLARKGRLKHICLPAELLYDKEGKLAVYVNPPELVRYYKHKLLDPHRLNKQNLDEFHKTLGEYGYSGQYLQDPVPLTGATFDTTKLAINEVCPRMVRLVRGWDKAATAGGGAYSAGVLIGLDKFGDYWILDVVRGQWNPSDRERVIKQTTQMDSKGAHARLVGHGQEGFVHVETIIEKEGGSGGVESSDNSIRTLAGFHVIGKRVTGDKEARAYAFASQVGVQGHVHVLNREWTFEYIQELRFFPHGKYKDQTDASSLAFNRIAKPLKRVGGGVLVAR